MKKMSIFVPVLCAFTAVYAVVNIRAIQSEYRAASDEYEELVSAAVSAETPSVSHEYVEAENFPETDIAEESTPAPSEIALQETYPEISVDTDAFASVNDDFYGFLYYEDVGIQLPVAHCDDTQYLHQTFTGMKNASGCPFVLNDEVSADGSCIVYGHNMKNGTMFGSMKNVLTNRTNPYFYMYGTEGKSKYRVFAAFITTYDSWVYELPVDDESYDKYVRYAGINGAYDDVPLTTKEDDALWNHAPIVVLSTCHGKAGGDERLVVLGVQIDMQTN